MMNLWIPDVGDQLRLVEDWFFPLFRERRNDGMITRVDPTFRPIGYRSSGESIGCCLPAGTVLQVDRVYIRSGAQRAWNSLTFYVKYHPGDKERPKYKKQSYVNYDPWIREEDHRLTNIDPTPQKLKGARFWAKLDSVNEIVCEPVTEKDRIK
jgi:hypothetical protein